MSRPIPAPRVWPDAAEVTASRRMWACLMLTTDVEIFFSLVSGRPVRAGQLDAEALRRALRGEALPPPDSYFRVRPGHLDAIAEGGPFHPKARTR